MGGLPLLVVSNIFMYIVFVAFVSAKEMTWPCKWLIVKTVCLIVVYVILVKIGTVDE